MTALPMPKLGEAHGGSVTAVVMAAVVLTIATGVLTLGGYWMTFIIKQNDVIRADVNIIRSEYTATHDKISKSIEATAQARTHLKDEIDAVRRRLDELKDDNGVQLKEALDVLRRMKEDSKMLQRQIDQMNAENETLRRRVEGVIAKRQKDKETLQRIAKRRRLEGVIAKRQKDNETQQRDMDGQKEAHGTLLCGLESAVATSQEENGKRQ